MYSCGSLVLISALAQILGLTTEHHSICTIPNGVLQVANLSYGGQAAAKLPLRNLWEASHMSGLPMIYNDLPAGRHIYIYIYIYIHTYTTGAKLWCRPFCSNWDPFRRWQLLGLGVEWLLPVSGRDSRSLEDQLENPLKSGAYLARNRSKHRTWNLRCWYIQKIFNITLHSWLLFLYLCIYYIDMCVVCFAVSKYVNHVQTGII